MATKLDNPDRRDRILNHPLLHFSKDQVILGLPAILQERLYMLEVTEKVSRDGSANTLQRGGESLVLHVNMGIQFL